MASNKKQVLLAVRPQSVIGRAHSLDSEEVHTRILWWQVGFLCFLFFIFDIVIFM